RRDVVDRRAQICEHDRPGERRPQVPHAAARGAVKLDLRCGAGSALGLFRHRGGGAASPLPCVDAISRLETKTAFAVRLAWTAKYPTIAWPCQCSSGAPSSTESTASQVRQGPAPVVWVVQEASMNTKRISWCGAVLLLAVGCSKSEASGDQTPAA